MPIPLAPDSMHLSAATVMSAPTSIEAYDAQMLDFSSDPDVPMNITGSAEFFAEAVMDHDGHLTPSTYGEHASVEVDMEEYVGDNAEYEMADETTEYQRPHGDELLDIEVYDASHAPSPLVASHSLQPSADDPIEHLASTSPAFSEHAVLPELRTEAETEVSLGHTVADAPHVEPSASGEGTSSDLVASELSHPIDTRDESILPTSEFRERLDHTGRTNRHSFGTPALVDVDKEAELHNPTLAEERLVSSEAAQQENPALPSAQDASPVQDEKTADQAPESVTEKETVDPLHISDGVYIDPPPAVLLSIADLSEPLCALFNQPHVEGESTEESHDNQKIHSLLLKDRPTLYYEPLSSVFEALRQDEALLSRVPHSFQGELVLDAYDLQLAVSEDNVHSREISLHDLNILHDGSDFVGPLRLLLRAIVPRFIIRYYALQEQIQKLNVAVETGEGDHNEEHHGHYDADQEQPQPLREEAVTHSSEHAAVPSERLTEAEEFVKEPLPPVEPTEETLQDNYEPDDTSDAQEPAADDQTEHAHGDDDDYEDTNVGDKDASVKRENIDTDQIHDTVAEETDAPTTVTEQVSEFGGEQIEYLDYVQPEEYDERYDEDLPERDEGAPPVHYGEPSHYEGEGEQYTSTAVEAILPGLDEREDDNSAATPTSVHAVLEPELSELADDNVTSEPAPHKQEDSVPSTEEFVTDEFTNEGVRTQVSGNQDTDAAQAKILLDVEKSDSNFVSMLEREADAEFDRTFNSEQLGQEGSTEITLQHDEAWDEWDDEDAEGEDEEDWIDPDAVSNESSVTLSSKASSKRNYDEVDPNEEAYVEDLRSSPGSKRPRVQ